MKKMDKEDKENLISILEFCTETVEALKRMDAETKRLQTEVAKCRRELHDIKTKNPYLEL